MTNVPKPGDQIHFLESGVIYPSAPGGLTGVSEVSRRSQTVTVTGALLEANQDKNGRLASWLLLAGDPEAQKALWGRVKVALGPAPADLTPWTPGTADAAIERDRQRAVAHRLPDPDERNRELIRIDRLFGRESTSRTLSTTRERR